MKAHLILLISIFVTLACSFQRKETDSEVLDVLHAKSAKPNFKGHCVERQIAVHKYLKRTETEDDLSLNNATVD